MGEAAAVGAWRAGAFSAHPAGRLARRAARSLGAAQGPARICAKTSLSSENQKPARLRSDRAVNAVLPQGPPHGGNSPGRRLSGNPGPGGWGAILKVGDHWKELKGGEANTTNNRM